MTERFEARAKRAETLAVRYPASAESLRFFARVSLFQASRGTREELIDLLQEITPNADAVEELAERVLAEMKTCTEHQPQLGVLRREGDGAALWLACGICRQEWFARRSACPACEQPKLAFYAVPEFPHVSLQCCENCKTYLHLIDMEKDPHAIPEADEIAVQPLDVWAIENGYAKIMPNLAGV